ncbi:hypothetical protein ACGF5C_26235 [Micromonospora sp. NPDC047620]|uniref:hypothetical protein n=1 Tax=Micromonospora sp. NPDC047620 TaxID=3364251 RepID=UPI003711D04A
MIENAALLLTGAIEILPAQGPLTLLVWGPGRALPVRIEGISIVEQAFDPELFPTRASVDLSARVLSYALKARSAAELGYRKALGEAAGRLMGSGGAVDPWPLVKVMYYAARRGVQTVAELRRDARLIELMGDVSKMTRASRTEITTAFRRVRRIISTGERRRMDEATIMRYVDQFAAERPDEEAFAALLKDMRAWRPPTQEQVLAETRLTAASEQLASLRRTRAELEAERTALRQEPAGSRDTARIREIDQELVEHDGLDLRTGRPTGEGLIRRAEEALGKAERLAEQARLDPTTRMRQVFGASKERADLLAKVKTDQVGPLRTPPQGLEVDHVVSLNRMSQMAGFDKLRATERAALAVRRDNLVVMDASANSSKGERSWAGGGSRRPSTAPTSSPPGRPGTRR